MYFLRKAVGIVAIIFLPVFLFAFGLLFSLYQVYGTPDHIKAALEKSGAYDTLVQDALSSLPSPEEAPEREGFPIDDPEIQRIIHEAAPPEFLKEQTTAFFDALYAWIRGEEPQLAFTIDFSDAKADLADGLARYADERLVALPVCTAPPDTDISDFEALDVFNLECVPPGFDRAAAVQRVHDEIAGDELLEDSVLTAEDLANEEEGRTPEQQLQGLRNAYTVLLTATYVTGIVALLCIAGAVFGPGWRIGLRRTAIVAITVGAMSALLAWAGAFLFARLSASLAADSGNDIQATLTDVVSHLAADVRNWWVGYSVLLIILGIGALITLRLTRPPLAQTKKAVGTTANNAVKTAYTPQPNAKTDKSRK